MNVSESVVKDAARHNPGAKHHLVAAVEHQSGVVLAQEAGVRVPVARPCSP